MIHVVQKNLIKVFGTTALLTVQQNRRHNSEINAKLIYFTKETAFDRSIVLCYLGQTIFFIFFYFGEQQSPHSGLHKMEAL